jgi:hypothetical protein
MKHSKTASIIWWICALLLLAGEIQAIYKAINSNWDPIGKREIAYTASAICGLGSIVGWFDIPDDNEQEK